MKDNRELARLREEQRERALSDFYWFTKYVYGSLFGDRQFMVPHVHRPICDALQKWPETDGSHVQLILYPRGTGKSTIGSGSYALWSYLRNPNLRILITNEVLARSKSFLGSIKETILHNQLFRELFGDRVERDERGKPKHWNLDSAVFSGRHGHGKILKEPTVDTGSIDNVKVGNHYDLIICDDLVSDSTVATVDQIEKVERYFRMLLPIADPGSKIVVIGTRYHYDDLYGTLLKEGMAQDVLIESAKRPDGKLLFPEVLNEERLKYFRSYLTPYQYSCQLDNNPVDSKTATFRREDFQYLGNGMGEKAVPKEVAKFMFVDPAATGNATSDYSAIVVVAVDDQKDIYVVYADRRRENSPKLIVDWIFDAYGLYQPQFVGVESVAFSRLLSEWLKEESKKPGRPFIPVFEVQQHTHASKEMRIRGMEPFFRGKKVWLQRGMHELEDELIRFPKSKHDDLIDALSMFPRMVYSPAGARPVEQITDQDAWRSGLTRPWYIVEKRNKRPGEEWEF